MTGTPLYYLGPQGTFTHQAALAAASDLSAAAGRAFDLTEETTAARIFARVEAREGWGIVAWENNVEGYVTSNLDALLDARDALAIDRITVDIAFDAFVRPGHGALTEATAHPHGLAQCSRFIAEHGLTPRPADSNAAACRDATGSQVALGPAVCGRLYGLETLESGVQDVSGAHTDFLVITPRDEGRAFLKGAQETGEASKSADDYESILGFVPLDTGSGVLASVLEVLRYARLNMTSFISRPIKGHDGTYTFVATIDAAPWSPAFHDALAFLTARNTWAKTLGVYPRRTRPDPPVSAWMLPEGGVRPGDRADDAASADSAGRMNRELLWEA